MPARLLTADLLPSFADALETAERVAVDTEFHAERRYVPKLYLVQVYVPGGEAWIIDPLDGGILQKAATALRSVPWIVHGGSQDIRLLGSALGGVPEVVLDTQLGSALLNERFPEGYASLVQRFLGRTLPKTSTLSDWSRRPLSAEQLRYAMDDVLRLPELWQAIEHRLEDAGRLEAAHLACAEARAQHLIEPEPTESWRRFAAATGMTWRARAILRELCTWREALAQERNQPPRTLLGDGSVVELSKRPPRTRDGILANRRFPRSAQKHIDAIWSAIERGRACREADAPSLPERYSSRWRAMHASQAWAKLVGHEVQVSPRLVFDDERIESLVMAPPQTREELRQRLGWRDLVVGDLTWSWLRGASAMRFDGGTPFLTTIDSTS